MAHPYQDTVQAAVAAKAGGRTLGAGCAGPGGSGDLRRDNGSVDWLIPKSPRLALARAVGVDMVPFEFVISTNFAAAGQATNTDQGPNKPISRDVLLYNIDIDIQSPNAFVGDEFKSQYDYFFAFTSGIQGSLNIYGAQKRNMPYAPLRAFNGYCSPDEPWVVTEEQIPSIDFTTTTALPTAGVVVTVTFIGKTPAIDTTFRMSPVDAINCLAHLGYCVDPARKLWGC